MVASSHAPYGPQGSKQEPYRLRTAVPGDVPALVELISRSARGLGAADYRAEQIEGALLGAFGVDSQLVADGTYLVIEHPNEADNQLAACGGWSFRRTLFGGDARAERDAAELDPSVDAAKIRAFFVAPEHARRGLGSWLLEECEAAARKRGFRRLELMGTLTGVPLYSRHGFVPQGRVDHAVGSGVTIEFVPMSKDLE